MQSTTVTHSDNAFDLIEKEQEGIVLKLLHEINYLRDENKHLKQLLLNSNSLNNESTSPLLSPHSLSISTLDSSTPQSNYFYHPRSPSLSSSISSASSSNSGNKENIINNNNNNISIGFPMSISDPTPLQSSRRATITTMTNLKRTPISNTVNSSLLTIPHQSPKKRTCSSGSSTSTRPILKPHSNSISGNSFNLSSSSRSRSRSGSMSTTRSSSRSTSIPRSDGISRSPTPCSPIISKTIDNRPVLFDTGIFSMSKKPHIDLNNDSFYNIKSHKRSVSDNLVSFTSDDLNKLSLSKEEEDVPKNQENNNNKTQPSTGLKIIKN